MKALNYLRALTQGFLGFILAVVTFFGSSIACGYLLPHDPNLRNAYLSEMDQMVVGTMITLVSLAVALSAHWSPGALFVTFGFVVLLLYFLNELTNVGAHTALPLLIAGVSVVVIRAIYGHLTSKKA
jgi:hypothetical protein